MITALSDKLISAGWKTYYKFKLKDEYASKVKSASKLLTYMSEQNNSGIGIGRNYDIQGNQIRGWHRRSHHRPPTKSSHPLIDKYC
jgi:hypothetical protein